MHKQRAARFCELHGHQRAIHAKLHKTLNWSTPQWPMTVFTGKPIVYKKNIDWKLNAPTRHRNMLCSQNKTALNLGFILLNLSSVGPVIGIYPKPNNWGGSLLEDEHYRRICKIIGTLDRISLLTIEVFCNWQFFIHAKMQNISLSYNWLSS